MMFSKNNTNFNGQSLCASCAYGLTIAKGEVYHCRKDYEVVEEVGVCKAYEAAKSDQ